MAFTLWCRTAARAGMDEILQDGTADVLGENARLLHAPL